MHFLLKQDVLVPLLSPLFPQQRSCSQHSPPLHRHLITTGRAWRRVCFWSFLRRKTHLNDQGADSQVVPCVRMLAFPYSQPPKALSCSIITLLRACGSYFKAKMVTQPSQWEDQSPWPRHWVRSECLTPSLISKRLPGLWLERPFKRLAGR